MAPSIIGDPRQTDFASPGEAWLAAEWPRGAALWTSIGSLFIPMWDGRFHPPPPKRKDVLWFMVWVADHGACHVVVGE